MVIKLTLTSGIPLLDEALDGLEIGNLVLLKGGLPALELTHLLCVRCQLPRREGGLGSPVLWLDGGNTFHIYTVTELAEGLGLDPEQALKGIYLSRAFTCYQMSALILEKLRGAVKRFGTKLVIVSNLPSPYLESDIPQREAVKAFLPVAEELKRPYLRRRALILASSLDPPVSEHGKQIEKAITAAADLVLRMRERSGGIEIRAERSSKEVKKVTLGAREMGTVPLIDFEGGGEDG